ncbi:hypothetical protein CMI45_03195 [Candidatus Pacearchaeota archaeon]|nr:hypothetical protein [Candidatus Pacearchaeota archaeon]|tara:strand:- start:334 stop:879 length:546 start_codon:yes stop_codon:yes gene_type:complete
MNSKSVYSLITRYLILVIVAIPNLFIFYKVFTPLTVYLSYLVLSLFSQVQLTLPSTLNLSSLTIEIIPACVAGAAYYLLLLLNLTTPMALKKRIKSILFLFTTFLILNVIRISAFALIITNGYTYFDLAHKVTWYFGSTILVILIWFANVYIFKIREIPVYSDFLSISKDIKHKKSKKRKR